MTPTASSQNLVSPSAMFEAAKRLQLGGRDPITEQDWALVINFVSFNVVHDYKMNLSCVKLFALIFDCPLADYQIEYICRNQCNQPYPPESEAS